jgi:glycosyltransferase involved in cell wall biosynthesis
MTLSVAICTWNRCESLRATLEQFCSVRVPTGTEWELLVVNNNCTDATDSVVQAFQDRLPVRLLHEMTAGQSYARNLAVREARGEYLLWTDDDVIVDPGWLEALLAPLVTGIASWSFGRSQPSWPDKPPSWYSDRFRGHFAVLDYGPDSFRITDYMQHFYGLNFAGTVEAHRALGGFRNDFGFKGDAGGVGEDIDLFQRAFDAGMPIVYCPDALVKHVIPEQRTRKTYHRRRHWVANEVYYKVLPEMFSRAPWFLGLPRFFFGHAANDTRAYLRCVFSGERSEAFYYELRLVRFARLLLEAARRGFRRPAAPAIGNLKESIGS